VKEIRGWKHKAPKHVSNSEELYYSTQPTHFPLRLINSFEFELVHRTESEVQQDTIQLVLIWEPSSETPSDAQVQELAVQLCQPTQAEKNLNSRFAHRTNNP